ncbi:MAG: hypothetical protein DGJ47_000705 [Rickettsiaceae bacterium]
MKHRNTNFILNESANYYQKAVQSDLMQVTIKGRKGKQVVMPDGSKVVEFINCSYLGLDLHPKIVKASKVLDNSWGVNFCCARSRFSIEPQRELEEKLSSLFGGRAITFPSVTTTHVSVLPLIASGILLDAKYPPKVTIVFDRFAHSSTQYLKPILAQEAEIETIAHNDLEHLRRITVENKNRGRKVVYVADGIYSMGGLCPIKELLSMAEELDMYIYLDDAHGTSIFGQQGEGPVLHELAEKRPKNLFISFCLSKGFGCNGGGILLPTKKQELTVRTYGQIYAFSAALDFSIVNACLEAIHLHKDGTVHKLQNKLRDNVALYDSLMNLDLPFSPIRMIMIGNEDKAIEFCKSLLNQGFFTSVTFFPIVPRDKAQIRICIAANHTTKQIKELISAVKLIMNKMELI